MKRYALWISTVPGFLTTDGRKRCVWRCMCETNCFDTNEQPLKPCIREMEEMIETSKKCECML